MKNEQINKLIVEALQKPKGKIMFLWLWYL